MFDSTAPQKQAVSSVPSKAPVPGAKFSPVFTALLLAVGLAALPATAAEQDKTPLPGGKGVLPFAGYCPATSSKAITRVCIEGSINWKLWTLMDEPVEDFRLKWRLTSLTINGAEYTPAQLKPFAKKLAALEITLVGSASVDSIYSNNLYLPVDTGVATRAGTLSYNTPGSPSWDKLFTEGRRATPSYLSREQAREYFRNSHGPLHLLAFYGDDAKTQVLGLTELANSMVSYCDSQQSAAPAYCNGLKDKVQSASREETELWERADSSNDQAAVEDYLKRYPAGRYVKPAQAKLKILKEEAAKGPAMVKIPGKNYELGKYEVTQKEWRDIMGNNPSKFSSCGDTCPVENVSWNDVQEFIQKLNAKTGKQYRLPTEAEWEYACYGASQTEYCGGNNLDAVGWYWDNSNKTTHPVGQKQANGYGLYDMSGNVYEWVQDWYDSSQRVQRGGSWFGDPQKARAAYRHANSPRMRADIYGLRLARTLP